MAADVLAFGQPTSQAIAQRVLNSPTLNATPSPATPKEVPVDGLTRAYARLLSAAYEIRKADSNVVRLSEIDRIVAFADQSLQDVASTATTAGPPVPSMVAPPPPPQPAQPAGAAPGAPGPGGPQAPGAA